MDQRLIMNQSSDYQPHSQKVRLGLERVALIAKGDLLRTVLLAEPYEEGFLAMYLSYCA